MRRTQFISLFIFIAVLIPSLSGVDLQAQCKQEGSWVVCRDARFQFLTPSFVRMEFAPGNFFTDAPTTGVLKRDWKQIPLEIWADKEWMVAKTSKLILRYKVNSGRFTKDNLQITWKEGERRVTWTPGTADKGNLGGTTFSLDGLRKDKLPTLEPGILSRSGYFLLDDSRTPTLDAATGWIQPRRGASGQDWYFVYYNKEYTQTLKLFADLCGSIPMIPRYTLGPWITDLNYEYLPGKEMVDKYTYTDADVKKMVDRWRGAGLPLDVLVLDFAWHKFGWQGGYDWSPVFPQPKAFLDWARTSGLKISLNDHPGYGKESVLSNEDSRANDVRTEMHLPIPEKPNYTLELSPKWKFKTDPKDEGVAAGWAGETYKDDSWAAIESGKPWETQGNPGYNGVAWYRQVVSLPVNAPPVALYMLFGGVDDEYDLFINGAKVIHHGSKDNSVYNTLTFTDVNAYLGRGMDNVVAVRVNDWGGDGGLTAGPFVVVNKRPPGGIRFNLANQQQAQTFMDVLHKPLFEQGIDFWWVDGGRGAAEMEGLNPQLWTNKIFYEFTEAQTKKRGFIFSRYGGWGSHRYPSYFTGDTYAQWEVLAYQVPFTAQGGNVLMPYITHDIGGFIGPNISFDLYTRWVQFGVFSPFLRVHSAHENPREGNVRMPWTYGEKGLEMAKKFFRLRHSLIPYIYTYVREANEDAMPIVRPMYLESPGLDNAYKYPGQYYFGSEFLVAPVTDSSGRKDVFLPAGDWMDYFTGENLKGGQVIRKQYPLDRMPVFVKAGSIIPMQRDMAYSDQRPLDTLIVDVYGPKDARFQLYEDDGVSLGYKSGEFATTPLAFVRSGDGYQLTVSATRGSFNGQVKSRAYEVRLHGLAKPRSVSANQRNIGTDPKAEESWTWDAAKSILTVLVKSTDIRSSVNVTVR